MNFFHLIRLYSDAHIEPLQCKIHLASWNGNEDPLNVFLAGNFKEWQSWQTKRNFERPYIVSMINLPHPDKWLFAGIYNSHGYETLENSSIDFKYDTSLVEEFSELIGRLVISFKRTGRQSYLKAEKWSDSLMVAALREKKITIADFPGFNQTKVMKPLLDVIVKEQIPSWKSALSSVAGVYLITDVVNGKQYVGSAYGNNGLWGRWSEYSYTGHGNNKELRRLLKQKGNEYSKNFQFSILEIADTHASKHDVLKRESHWKDVLRSYEFGYNEN